MTRNRFATCFLVGVIGLVPVSVALAQGMTSDQIIRSLQPGTRGIRPVGPAGAPASGGPGPAALPGAGVRPGSSAPAQAAINLTVQFASGSADLTPQAVRTLDELGRALSSTALAGYRFRIEGHTDTVGVPETNKALSEARAARVLEYLASKWSVDRAKVQTAGMGQEQPLVPTGPNVPELRNRRVTVINLGA